MSWAEIVINKGKEVLVGTGETADNYSAENEKSEVSGGEEVERSDTLGSENEKLDTGTSEPNFEADNGEKFTTSGGDSVVEAVHVDTSESGVVFVGGVEESKDSETKEDEVLADGSVPLNNGFDKISRDVEGPGDVDIKSEKNVEAVTDFSTEPAEMECNGKEIDVSGVVEGVTPAINGAVTKESLDMMEVSVEKNEPNETIDKELELETDKGIKQIEPAVETAIDVSDAMANYQVDGGNGDETLAINSNSEIPQTNVADGTSNAIKELEDEVFGGHDVPESAELGAVTSREVELEAENEEENLGGGDDENKGSVTDGENEGMIFGSSEAARQFLEELERGSGIGAHDGAESSHDHSERIDGQIVTDSDEEVDTDEEGRQTNQVFSLDAAKRTALQLEAEGKEDLEFSLNILVLGKAGVGKSATINSIFGEEKSPIHAFEPATNSVKEITGLVDGIKIRVIDCPGLKSSGSEQGLNRKLLSSVKKFMKKCPPDIVLYVDRLDTQTRDLNDLPLLRSITSSLGSSIWRNAVVTLTHAASAPPDGPSGSPLSYEVFVAQRSHVVQQSIGQAVGDLRLMNPSLMNPVSLVENHSSCRKNRDGQKVLPNGQTWRPQLLMLCYSMKILSEASSLSKPQDPFDHRKLFGFRSRSPPLPYLLSWLLQSRSHPKLSSDQGVDNVDSDVDLADLSDSDDEEEEDEYDQLPPFKPLRKNQLAKLSKEQKKAYFEEYDYRVKLLQKKQWREELRRMREIRKKGKAPVDEYGYNEEDVDPENGAPAAVPVPLPDMVLPPSFDGDNPAYRYRFLEPTSQFLARPVLDTHGWDHDCGYDGVNVEHSLAIVNRFPATVAVQVTKDKKEFSVHLDSSVSAKHGDKGSSMAGFDIQNVGKQLAYIFRGETKFKNFKMNKTAAGVSVTFLGQNVASGFKLEDQIALGKRLMLVGSTGTVLSQGDSAYGANLEVRLREADYPIGQDQSSLGLSLVKWRGDLALGANLQSQFSIGRNSKIAVRAGLNNKMSGQLTVRTSSSDQLQIALVGLLPIAMSIYKSLRPGVSESYMY
ncbi:protein translocase, putative [Ricinus communis]|uniref:Protein translocase, putative n=1 Tax=Ricinus communis TaxID=3988 RepID=B9T0W6_RICCO|nr:protein translocase, putative [Ricinus communis]